ncbi:hypothetical protein ACQ86N_06605 [Puia sp. P3]|uniref:hypothetical protein n=1 Tax=Puia sp. P3 TaxID=3423952 RepID=UPI003D670C70
MRLIACFCLLLGTYLVNGQETVQMGRVKLVVALDREGTPVYSVNFGDKAVVLPSRMGFVLKEDSLFTGGLAGRGWTGGLWMRAGSRCGVRWLLFVTVMRN